MILTKEMCDDLNKILQDAINKFYSTRRVLVEKNEKEQFEYKNLFPIIC